MRFEPSGFTGNPEIPIAKSITDYIFRWLGSQFLTDDDKAMLGLQPATVTDSSTSGPLGGFGGQSPSLPSVPETPSVGPASQETSATGAQSPADAGRPPADRSEQAKATAVASVSCRGAEGYEWRAQGHCHEWARERSHVEWQWEGHEQREWWRRTRGHAEPWADQGLVPDPGRRPQLRRLRLDHDPQRQLL